MAMQIVVEQTFDYILRRFLVDEAEAKKSICRLENNENGYYR